MGAAPKHVPGKELVFPTEKLALKSFSVYTQRASSPNELARALEYLLPLQSKSKLR
jgi:hypothetical protein